MRRSILTVAQKRSMVNLKERTEYMERLAWKNSNRSEWQSMKDNLAKLTPSNFEKFDEYLLAAEMGPDVLMRYCSDIAPSNSVLATFAECIDDEVLVKNLMNRFDAAKHLTSLSDLATQDFLDIIDNYHKANYGLPKFLPAMLGDLYTELSANNPDGYFFKASSFDEIRKIFKIGRIDLEDSGWCLKFKYTLLIPPHRDFALIRPGLLHRDYKTKLAARGWCYNEIFSVVGIDYAKHKAWYDVAYALRQIKIHQKHKQHIHTRPNNYKPNRCKRILEHQKERSDKGGTHKPHKPHKPHKQHVHKEHKQHNPGQSTRLIWDAQHSMYFTVKHYADHHGLTIQAVYKRCKKLGYNFTLFDCNNGHAHTDPQFSVTPPPPPTTTKKVEQLSPLNQSTVIDQLELRQA